MARNKPRHMRTCVLCERRQYMTVDVERDRDRRVTEQVLNNLWMHTLVQKVRPRDMAYLSFTFHRGLQRAVEGERKVGHVAGTAQRIREDQVVLLPLLSRLLPLSIQVMPMRVEYC